METSGETTDMTTDHKHGTGADHACRDISYLNQEHPTLMQSLT